MLPQPGGQRDQFTSGQRGEAEQQRPGQHGPGQPGRAAGRREQAYDPARVVCGEPPVRDDRAGQRLLGRVRVEQVQGPRGLTAQHRAGGLRPDPPARLGRGRGEPLTGARQNDVAVRPHQPFRVQRVFQVGQPGPYRLGAAGRQQRGGLVVAEPLAYPDDQRVGDGGRRPAAQRPVDAPPCVRRPVGQVGGRHAGPHGGGQRGGGDRGFRVERRGQDGRGVPAGQRGEQRETPLVGPVPAQVGADLRTVGRGACPCHETPRPVAVGQRVEGGQQVAGGGEHGAHCAGARFRAGAPRAYSATPMEIVDFQLTPSCPGLTSIGPSGIFLAARRGAGRSRRGLRTSPA